VSETNEAANEPRPRRAGPTVWLVRLLTLAMLGYGIFVAQRKFAHTPEQDELARYVELEVPSLLEQVARAHALLDRLSGALSPEQARSLLVDEAMPLLVQARKRAAAIEPSSPSVKAANAEYLEALDKLIEMCRSGVRAIDDPALPAADGYRQLRDRRRAADDALAAWLDHLRASCVRAGLRVDPAKWPTRRPPAPAR